MAKGARGGKRAASAVAESAPAVRTNAEKANALINEMNGRYWAKGGYQRVYIDWKKLIEAGGFLAQDKNFSYLPSVDGEKITRGDYGDVVQRFNQVYYDVISDEIMLDTSHRDISIRSGLEKAKSRIEQAMQAEPRPRSSRGTEIIYDDDQNPTINTVTGERMYEPRNGEFVSKARRRLGR